MTNQVTRNINSIRRLGFNALTEKLGPIGMVEFMRQFDTGYGDYTKERHSWLDKLTIEDIHDEIVKMKKHSQDSK